MKLPLALNRLTSRLPKSYSLNADSLAISYRTKDNNVKMTAVETTNGGVRSNGGTRDYTRVCLSSCFIFSLICYFFIITNTHNDFVGRRG